MILRIILMFVILAAGASGVLYLAACTDYFNVVRVKRMARNAALVAGGFFVALLTLSALVALNA